MTKCAFCKYRKQLAARFVAWREFAELARNPSTGF
jgi:putative transposase